MSKSSGVSVGVVPRVSVARYCRYRPFATLKDDPAGVVTSLDHADQLPSGVAVSPVRTAMVRSEPVVKTSVHEAVSHEALAAVLSMISDSNVPEDA